MLVYLIKQSIGQPALTPELGNAVHELVKEMRAIGTNVNQIARHGNQLRRQGLLQQLQFSQQDLQVLKDLRIEWQKAQRVLAVLSNTDTGFRKSQLRDDQ